MKIKIVNLIRTDVLDMQGHNVVKTELLDAEAEIFTIDGFDQRFAVHNTIGDFNLDEAYTVSELSTSSQIAKGPSPNYAKTNASKKLFKFRAKWPKLMSDCVKKLEAMNVKYPVN